jgi:hypothetical protein
MSLLTDYQRDGYLICRDLVEAATVTALREVVGADVKCIRSRFAPHDHRDIVMACGEDAFAERGLEDLARPCLRLESATSNP